MSGVFTNVGVIHRLAPAQSIDTPNTPYTFDDGVGQATVVVTQTGGAALGATTARVRVHLAQTAITCAGVPLPVTGVRRFFTITPTSSATATADLKLSYFAGVQNSEANGVTPPNLRFSAATTASGKRQTRRTRPASTASIKRSA